MNYYYYFVEIKNRGILFFITLISVICVVYEYKEILLFIICANKYFSFIHTNITEIFYTYIKLISFITNQICLVYLFFHLVIFLIPGLYKSEQLALIRLFYISIFTYIFAILFLNRFLIPFSFDFFLSFQNAVTSKSLNFYFEAKVEDYLHFFFTLHYICQFYSQLFVFLLSFYYYYDNKLEEIKLFRKVFYFLLLCFLFNMFSLADTFLQMFFCSCISIIIYEFIVFFLFITKTWETFNKKITIES